MGNVVSFARFLGDGLTNLVSRMGTDRDKAASSVYAMPMLSEVEAINAYRGSWLPRKIVDIPAMDSCRKWRNWQAEEDQITAIEAEEKRLNVKAAILEARIKARLLGGCAVMIGTGEEDTAAELPIDRMGAGGIKHLTVIPKTKLTAGEIDTDPASEFFGKPVDYKLQTTMRGELTIHPSRLVIFLGHPNIDEDHAGNNRGWGDSVLVALYDAIRNADATAANIASLVFEAKVDVVRVPNFMQSLANPGYEADWLKRFQLAATAKGINGTLILDKEEEYSSKSASFATLPDILDRFLQIVSGAADIPATRLLGQSPAGLNSTGIADMKNYHDRIQAQQELEMTPAMARLDECIIRSALGTRPPEVWYSWAPLEQMSDKEKADILKVTADAARAIAGAGGMSPELMPIEALSDALVNTLVEQGVMPGLEQAIKEYGKLSEQGDDDDDARAAVTPPPAEEQNLGDAAPRTLYVQRKVENAADIIAWAKSQGFETTLPADDLHVTIAFSREPVDWMKVGEAWQAELKIAAGGPRLMEQFGEATVLLFGARELEWRHEDIKRAGASWDHPEYQPHITISYAFKGDLSEVEPYQGEIVLGPEIFAEVREDWQESISEE